MKMKSAYKYRTMITCLTLLMIHSAVLYGAVGCTLKDPDRDIRRLFPKATNYKTEFYSIQDNGYPGLRAEVEAKLNDTLDTIHEPNDVPYAYYTVLQDKNIIGYVHGVNQKGRFGGMQLIVTTDPEGKILDFYYQKLTSPEAGKFRDKDFTKQFVSLTLKDFYTRNLTETIPDPSEDSKEDYIATLRGLKKNLILYDIFKLNKQYDQYFMDKQIKKESKNHTNPNNKQKDNKL